MSFRILITSLFSFLLIAIFACKKIVDPIYLLGQPIPNTEIFLPLGSNPGGSPAARPKISADGAFMVYKQFHRSSGEPLGLYIMDLSTFEKGLLKEGISARNADTGRRMGTGLFLAKGFRFT